MPRSTFAESILALAAGPTHAAAIYGDLVEMAATRGQLWFVAAYLRTLVSLTWRIVLALFVADIARQFLFDLFHLYLRHTPAVWRYATGAFVDLLNSSGPLLACIMSTLWFALPFALVRYGRRDRFVQLAAAVAVGTTVAFLAIPWLSLFSAAATVGLALAALFSTQWRRPVEILAITGAAGLLFIAAASGLISATGHAVSTHALPAIFRYSGMLLFQGSLLVIAIVCTRLHRRLEPAGRTPA
jgi:hypothetical protein